MQHPLALVSSLLILGGMVNAAGCDSEEPPSAPGVPDGGGGTAPPDPGTDGVLDLASLDTAEGGLLRIYGSEGRGDQGVPVASGGDCDGDGAVDLALAAFLARPFGRNDAGQVYLAFGNGTTHGEIDTATESPDVLRIAGAEQLETLGNEIWMDDVTGDGIADLLICRQNFRPDQARPGAGALTILVGGPSLRSQAEAQSVVDLANPPDSLTLTTFVGANAVDRLGIWVRTADVTGDGTLDVIVGADQEDGQGNNSGATYVIRGGEHLASGETVDLANFGQTSLAGDIAKIVPPRLADGYHLGATCAGADLDGNGRAEVLTAAALNRSGASAPAFDAPPGSAESSGGTENGTLYIAWDDNFTGDSWPDGYTVALDEAPGTVTAIHGSARHESFGEEINGGVDFDDDGAADLFVGDLKGDLSPDGRPVSGVGHVIYNIASLRGMEATIDELPEQSPVTTLFGAAAADISSDTSVIGDFDGDSIADIAIGSPSADPIGRNIAGTIHVLFGQAGGWPETIDLAMATEIDETEARIVSIYGALGSDGSDKGDMICYSASGGDIDGDGLDDIVSNEMLGNGTAPTTIDVGNLIVISGAHLQ